MENYLYELSEISPKTQQHISKVYFTLGASIGTSVVSFLLSQMIHIPTAIFALCLIATVVLDIYYYCSKTNKYNLKYWALYLYAFSVGGTTGSSIYGLEQESKMFFYQISLSAFAMTTATFFMFSLFATLTHNRVSIYLGSLIGSAILAIASIFIFNLMVEIIVGIIICCCFIIVDTQNMIHRAESGVYDVAGDARELFVDFVKLFFKILEYLNKKEKEKKEKEKKKKEEN